MIVGKFVAVAVIGYLLGAIPFALIVSKRMAGIDVSKYGSGNIGGTNVLGSVGKKAGTVAIILDVGKAVAAVMLAKVIIGDSVLLVADFPLSWQAGQTIAALMAMVGHNWSVYIRFRGGKGVATYYGSWFAMYPAAALFGGVIIILTAAWTRYVSLGSMLGTLGILCLLIVLTLAYDFPIIYLVYSSVAAVLIVYQHRSNISRLRNGTEIRFGEKRGEINL